MKKVGRHCETAFDTDRIPSMFRIRVIYATMPLLIVAMVISSVGRAFVQCADGSPCTTMRFPAPLDCCHSVPCRIPASKKCIVKSIPAVERMAAQHVNVIQPLLFVQVIPLIALTPAPLCHRELEIISARPPDQPSPKLGHAPRPPPASLT